MSEPVRDVVVVGAGVAGLAAARRLAGAGRAPLILDRGRGLGGRCATWRLEGQPIDYGVGFLHGTDAEFLDVIRSVEGATVVPDWPRVVRGTGTPCQPLAFDARSTRLAYAEGLSRLPKWLARGLDIRRESTVARLAAARHGFTLHLASGGEIHASAVVLATAGREAEDLLAPLAPGSTEIEGARRVLAMLGSLPSLTIMATYDAAPPPAWDIFYPEDSRILQVIAHDSSKRRPAACTALVLQAHPGWSRAHLDDPPGTWGKALLEEAGRLVGGWAATPRSLRAHAWRHARVDAGSELARPLLLTVESGARLGVTGETFAPGGGVEAAWLSGHRLAGRILGDNEP